MTQIIEKNPHQAFEDALTSGVLTRETVGEYMYMYTDAIKGDAFKNITTRKYIFNPVTLRIGLNDFNSVPEQAYSPDF